MKRTYKPLSFFTTYPLAIFVLLSSLLHAQQREAVAKFSFDDGADYDEVSKLKIGMPGCTFTSDRFGNNNNAIYVYGNEFSYINLGFHQALKPKVGSISLWAKIERRAWAGYGFDINPILVTRCAKQEDFCEAYCMYYMLGSHKVEGASSRDSLRQASVISNEPLKIYQWHHLVLSYNNKFLQFYVDGNLQHKATKNYETKFLENDSVLIGIVNSKHNMRFMEGAVDDIAFYDYVLSDKEVASLYNEPNPNTPQLIIKWMLLCLIVMACIFAMYLFLKRRINLSNRKERVKLEMHNTLLETELRVNRALMNPHFVFNSLNTLQNFILNNENDRANTYLVKFSKLMRKILENNMSDTITLEKEVDLLQKYLEIEDMRFEENITYSIHLDADIKASSIKIPIMMLQPFVENAIWHGLLKKKNEKKLNISFSMFGPDCLQCIIDDNGVGRTNTKRFNPEKRSLGISFIEQRLNLFNKIHKLNCSLVTEDKPNHSGTTIKIILPIL